MDSLSRAIRGIEQVKNPAYTGENRCPPCTVVNVLLAGVLAAVAGIVATSSPAPGGLVATTVFGGELAVIYVRGYLVPGTPQLTKRYLPDRVLAIFDKDDAMSGTVDPEAELRRIGVIEADPAAGDVVLTPSFDRAWLEAIAEHTGTETGLRMGLADVLDLGPGRLEVIDRQTAVVAACDDAVIARWESSAACRADVGAAVVLSRVDPDWYRRPVAQRLDLLAALRFFLERCPTCAGTVGLAHETIESCCRTRDVAVVVCTDCGAEIAEVPFDVDAATSVDASMARNE
ncbi:hypothetical protein D8Y22_07165 [Salinadaptatus halalkaliphilus]|uniref:Uncharacterized protein n=1 Tax=Salinadaptatus halalkaliphilus TaxID=2419781 RepID=A0A4S3TN32_9EURY|nr:hypothetical protein [Salinadaptatus halalkaliphilus]THE65586.1 hypothetical protein D8Y22_07165 [Salinadaptatus halalkaliphilus]